jgi:hypothetical protein
MIVLGASQAAAGVGYAFGDVPRLHSRKKGQLSVLHLTRKWKKANRVEGRVGMEEV